VIIFTYLLSRDLVETLERKFGFSLDDALKEEIRNLEEKFVEDFGKYVPTEASYSAVNAMDISNQMAQVLSESSFPVVSLDRVYIPSAKNYLEVTRQTDQFTGKVKIAERPGSLSLEEQIKQIRDYGEITLADVGAFEGATLVDICTLLGQQGIIVKNIVLGISSYEANDKLRKISELTSFNSFKFFEWIELRDLFGIDGRNVGLNEGKRLFIPYWENLGRWASIAEKDLVSVADLSREANCKLIGKLWQAGYDLNYIGRPVKYFGEK
jgi:hypothetical protein